MKKTMIFVVLAALAVLPVVANGGSEGDMAESYTIEVSGSTTVYPLMELLGERYTELNPEISINANGTGSSDGVKAANQGTSELGMSSRNLKTEEKGFGLDELAIAYDGITPVVHPSNPVGAMTLEQIQAVYTGRITDWSELTSEKSGAIAVVSREPGSGTRGAFEDIVDYKDQLVAGASEFDGNGGVKAAVASNEDAMGYLSLGYLDDSVKGVAVEGAEPTVANVVNGSFPIARPLLVLYRGDSIAPQTQAFLDWAMSSEGQEIAATKWVPAK
ncbi:MAG: phosphate ABC transporter substrate-binding protein [Spirochaetaceae bacterium]|nr:phosphate ABC transporter substrate-binding protein [Spirochaetaceae bacterium]